MIKERIIYVSNDQQSWKKRYVGKELTEKEVKSLVRNGAVIWEYSKKPEAIFTPQIRTLD